VKTEVTEDRFVYLLGEKYKLTVPNIFLPKEQHNHGWVSFDVDR